LAGSIVMLEASACSESPPASVTSPKAPTIAEAPTTEARAPALPAAKSEDEKAPGAKTEGAKTEGAKPDPSDAPKAEAAAAPGDRIYAKARFAWVYPSPKRSNAWIGYASFGGSIPLRGGSAEKARVMGGAGCDAWYAVEPRGFVCAGSAATLDPNDPVVVALARDAPDVSSPWPYQYGESIGVPRYPAIPTPAEQRSTEWDLEEHLARVERARAAKSKEEVAAIDKLLVGVDLTPAGSGPPELMSFGPLVREERKSIMRGSTVAFTRAFDAGGRAFLLAADHAILPKDRVKPYPRSEFHGVELGRDVSLPIAFFRRTERPKYKRGEDGAIVPSGDVWPARAWVALTGEEIKQGEDRFLATRDPSVFAKADDATVIKAATEAPFLRSGGGDSDASRRTWIDVSVMGGWLVAYEGLTPVYATLVSPGRGGVPVEGKDPLSTASTPTGRFRIDGKFVTATMVSSTDDNLVHTEVQYIQNFSGPHALHAAYWHDAWGERKSGGCVNLAPMDAKHLFAWTEPRVPEGFHGLRSTKDFGPATEIFIHR
jgi:hypothetical protein